MKLWMKMFFYLRKQIKIGHNKEREREREREREKKKYELYQQVSHGKKELSLFWRARRMKKKKGEEEKVEEKERKKMMKTK